MRNQHVRLNVVAIPDTDDDAVCVFRTPLRGQLFLEGSGHVDADCGCCGATLMRGMRSITGVPGVVFVCPSCRCGNATPPPNLSARRPAGASASLRCPAARPEGWAAAS